ncbi:MAG TPA: DNA-binding transcriptional regulator [Clostridiales bacterium]|nr:DNA-binding transcriptional regulator [Clostridiales bacterium]
MKIDRLIGILTFLLQNDKSTAQELARRFEVSHRTILRDIDSLTLAGIPIVTTQGNNGGISIMSGYKLDKSVLTIDELQNIIIGLKGLGSVSKTSNIEQLIQKMSPRGDAIVSLHDHIFIDLSSYYKDSLSEKIKLIKQAITERRLIEFDYYYAKGKVSRKIEPYFMQFKWTSWYVFGWCCERENFRLFKLNRLWQLQLTDEYFLARPISVDDANKDMEFSEPNEASFLFDKSVRFRLIEDYGLNCYTETDEGLYLKLNYTNRDYIISWILGFGDKVTVLEPQDFKDEIKKIAKNIFDKYS